MAWKKVEKLNIRVVGKGNWNTEKLANDLKELEKGYYEMTIEEFMEDYYNGDWKALKQPVLRAKAILNKVIEEHKLNIKAYGSPKNKKIAIEVL